MFIAKQLNTTLGKAAISLRIVLVPIVTDPCFGRSAAFFCENSREPAITVEHYPIPSGGRSGAIASVLRGSGTEKVIGYSC